MSVPCLAKRLQAALMATLPVLSGPAIASAESMTTAPHPVRLVWTRALGAEACPEASIIEADVTQRLGANPFSPDAPGSIDVHVARDAGVWTALIEDRPTGGPPEGSRVVTSTAESCDSLALAVGLAVALMIRARTTPEPSEAPKAAPPAPPEPSSLPPPVIFEPPPREPSRHVAVFASAVGALRVLPRAAVGPSVSGRVPVADHASLLASLTFLPEQRSHTAGADVGFGATFGGLAGCYDSNALARFRFSGCASALLGALHVIVHDPAPLAPGARFWGALSLGLRSDWTVAKPVHFLVGVEALVPLQRRSYVVELDSGTRAAFVEPPWGALASAGLGVEL
jgi:hypothetical protein